MSEDDEDQDQDQDRDRDQEVEENEEVHQEARTLGPERWVQFTFVALAMIVFYLGQKLIMFVWELSTDYVGAPKEIWATVAALVLGVATGALLYRHPTVRARADEVAAELQKVSWPTREETWRNTIVTVVTSIIASIYLGLFDTLWGTFTDLIYGTA